MLSPPSYYLFFILCDLLLLLTLYTLRHPPILLITVLFIPSVLCSTPRSCMSERSEFAASMRLSSLELLTFRKQKAERVAHLALPQQLFYYFIPVFHTPELPVKLGVILCKLPLEECLVALSEDRLMAFSCVSEQSEFAAFISLSSLELLTFRKQKLEKYHHLLLPQQFFLLLHSCVLHFEAACKARCATL